MRISEHNIRLVRSARYGTGVALLALLIALAILGGVAASRVQEGMLAQRRAAEQELLAIGREFRNAMISYANATPPGEPNLPHSLDDLLRDPRHPTIQRHLRKIYVDPITGDTQWGLMTLPNNGGIVGIYSLSTAAPIKTSQFDPEFAAFTGKTSYAEWIFAFSPGDVPTTGPRQRSR